MTRKLRTSFEKLSGSLKTRIMAWFIIISLIPIIIFLVFSLSLIQKDAEKEVKTRLESAKNVAQQELNRLCKLSIDYSILIASNPELREAVARKDHIKVIQIIAPLASELSIHQIVITDNTGTLIGRSDILSRYGDNMKDNFLVRCGLARLKYTSVQNENGTIFVKSVSNIVTKMSANNMKVIGTISVGYKLDEKFIENLERLTKMKALIFSSELNKKISLSNTENVVDINDLNKMLSGQFEYIQAKGKKGNYHYILLPVRKSEKEVVAGVLALISQNGIVSSFVTASIRFSILLFIVTIVLVVIISLLVSNKITNPIIHLAENAKKVALGNFDVQIKLNNQSKDEISLLAKEFSRMVRNVHTFATNIAQTLKTTQQYVNKLNKVATDSATTSQVTGEQIKEIISLVENQQKTFEQTALMVSDLENQIQRIFDIFKMVQNEVSTIYNTTSKEQESIKMLINHMYTANFAINEVAKDLKKAMREFKEIAKKSQDISSLAEKIKIISLNASIEAAKREIPTFEVIASEISRLSQSANILAKSVLDAVESGLLSFDRTNQKLENALDIVEKGTKVAEQSSESLSRIENTNRQIKTKIENVMDTVLSQREKIFAINNVLKNQTQTVSKYFKMIVSIRDIFQSQKRVVDKLIDQFSEVHEDIVKLASITMGTEKNYD